MARTPRDSAAPDRDAVLAYLRDKPDAVSLSEMARYFGVKGKDRTALRLLLDELSEEGLLESPRRRRFASRERLPKVTVLVITGPDADGELRARPAHWPEDRPAPDIFVSPARSRMGAPAAGERILARLSANEDGSFDAVPMRRLGFAPTELVGVFDRVQGQGRLRPTDRSAKYDYAVAARHAHGAEPGELVRARVLPERSGAFRMAEVVERVGHMDDAGAIGLIALHSNNIPIAFPDAAIEEAEAAMPPTLSGRTDLRELSLVTIDDEDARDFDDAVFAEPDPTSGNDGGWRISVAIADVAHYVRSGGALDTAAERRGNSVYLPDRVVPMLPEALSNDLCSLRPGEDRAALVAHLRIDAGGTLIGHRFERALIRSTARLTYRQVQAAHDHDGPDGEAGWPDGLPVSVVENLYSAYASLNAARERRGTLELDLAEYKVRIADGKVAEIAPRTRLTSHRLIEEFMIAANVAAAETLEARRTPCMYRVHPPPDAARLEAMREFLESFGLTLPRGQVVRAGQLADLLARAAETASADVIHEAILRCQAQAYYSPRNLGHFGLALRRYAHFTSPIRRYSDLLVHRALVRALSLGRDGLSAEAEARFEEIGQHISDTERSAQAAEREALDRYLALYLQDRVGARMTGRIAGVTRFGLFVRLHGLGADGLLPISLLGDERFVHDEHRHTLEGQATGIVFTLGDEVEVILREAEPVTGGLVFGLRRHRPRVRPKGEPSPAHRRHKRPAKRGGPSRGPRRGRGRKGSGRPRGRKR